TWGCAAERRADARRGIGRAGEGVRQRDAHADFEPGAGAPDRRDDLPEEPRPSGEIAAVGPRPPPCREQFVQQITVAALHVDETEARRLRELRRSDEALAD